MEPGTLPTAWVAENDIDMRRLLAYTLRRAGFAVEEFGDGRALQQRIAALTSSDPTPALLVTDHHMPYVYGLEAVAELRAIRRDVYVVVVTGFGDSELHATAARLGVQTVLDKPFDLAELERVARGVSDMLRAREG
jgi:DNA-binding response OmpR family regulator